MSKDILNKNIFMSINEQMHNIVSTLGKDIENLDVHDNAQNTLKVKKDLSDILNKIAHLLLQLKKVEDTFDNDDVISQSDMEIINNYLSKHGW
jgi:hypothetical protein